MPCLSPPSPAVHTVSGTGGSGGSSGSAWFPELAWGTGPGGIILQSVAGASSTPTTAALTHPAKCHWAGDRGGGCWGLGRGLGRCASLSPPHGSARALGTALGTGGALGMRS